MKPFQTVLAAAHANLDETRRHEMLYNKRGRLRAHRYITQAEHGKQTNLARFLLFGVQSFDPFPLFE